MTDLGCPALSCVVTIRSVRLAPVLHASLMQQLPLASMQVCRTYNFGEVGSSKGMYYDTFLAPTRLNEDPVPWLDMNLSYLQLPR